MNGNEKNLKLCESWLDDHLSQYGRRPLSEFIDPGKAKQVALSLLTTNPSFQKRVLECSNSEVLEKLVSSTDSLAKVPDATSILEKRLVSLIIDRLLPACMNPSYSAIHLPTLAELQVESLPLIQQIFDSENKCAHNIIARSQDTTRQVKDLLKDFLFQCPVLSREIYGTGRPHELAKLPDSMAKTIQNCTSELSETAFQAALYYFDALTAEECSVLEKLVNNYYEIAPVMHAAAEHVEAFDLRFTRNKDINSPTFRLSGIKPPETPKEFNTYGDELEKVESQIKSLDAVKQASLVPAHEQFYQEVRSSMSKNWKKLHDAMGQPPRIR